MNGLVETPFKLTTDEILTSAAATLLLQQLSKSGVGERKTQDTCCPPQYGYTASASDSACGPRFVRITDIKGGAVNWDTVPYCVCPDPSAYELAAGDILVARSGSVGKSFIVSDVPETAVFASYMIRLRAQPGTLPAYVYWYFQSQQFWQQTMGARRGSAMKNINGPMLRSLRVPHPEKPIQNAVVRFLEDFRARLRGTNRELPELPSPLKEQRRIVACIEQLAAEIEEARRLRYQATEETDVLIRATVSKIDGDLRKTHLLTKLENFARGEKGSLRSGPFGSALLHEEFVADGVPAIGIQDVKENRFELSRKWNVTPEKAEDLSRYTIKPRDILVTVMGTLGRACVVPDEVPRMVSTKHVWTITLDQGKAAPRWVSFWLNYSRFVRDELLGQGTGTAIPGLNGAKIRSLSLPAIPLCEQQRIVGYLDGLAGQAAALARLQSETAAELDALLPSILDRAFKGEL